MNEEIFPESDIFPYSQNKHVTV